MKRRRALSAVAASILALRALPPAAQGTGKPAVVGMLDAGEQVQWWEGFRQQMRDLGYVEGRNVVYEARFAKGRLDDLPPLAKDLVQRRVAVIVTASNAAAFAAERATREIPIVMASGSDQVSRGLAESQARPGGNLTGVSSRSVDLMGKRLDLIREIVPPGTRIGVLWQSDNVSSMSSVRELDASAARARVAMQSFGIRDAADLPPAFERMARERVAAIVVVHGPLLYRERARVIDLARKHKVPAIYGASEYVDEGGLVSYGPSYPELFRRAALYVDRILKGAKPGDLPIEQAAVFDLVFNSNTAGALGITVPPALLARANRVLR